MSDADEAYEELRRQAAALVPDPDPEREEVACPDCLTPQLVLLNRDAGGQLLVIGHDGTCPFRASLVKAGTAYVVVDDEHTIVHAVRGQ